MPLDRKVAAALPFLGISVLVEAFLVAPRLWSLRGDSDLFNEDLLQVRLVIRFIWCSLACWLIGLTAVLSTARRQ